VELPPQQPQEPAPLPQQAQQPPLPSPQEHSDLAQQLLDLAENEPDPALKRRLNELAALNAMFGMSGEAETSPEPQSSETSTP
jgi:hypothetical protein